MAALATIHALLAEYLFVGIVMLRASEGSSARALIYPWGKTLTISSAVAPRAINKQLLQNLSTYSVRRVATEMTSDHDRSKPRRKVST